MLFCFADDAEQLEPTRDGMRPVVAVGGVFLPADSVGQVHRRLDQLCDSVGFPAGEEFKWSPGRELWMWENLREQAREDFFLGVLGILNEHDGQVVVVIVDTDAAAATGADTPREDATRLFLERASNRFHAARMDGMVLIDRPSGDRADENRFLAECVDHLRDDDTYAVEERFALPVLATQSRFVRLLQAADLIASCSLAFVAGEPKYSPPIFNAIRPMLASELGRKGGVGMKIHPDYRYVNLYHWLLGDTDLWRGNMGTPLPLAGRQYATGDGMRDPE